MGILIALARSAQGAEPSRPPACVLVERGRVQVQEAQQFPRSSDERRQRLESARKQFQEADRALADAEKQAEEAIKKLGFVDPRDLARNEARDQLRREQLQRRLERAWVLYETAQTFEPDSPGRQSALSDAMQRFGDLYEKHGERLVGLYARLGQGRCYRDLDQPRKAFAAFEGLLAWPDEPEAFRTMKTKAALEAIETALLAEVRKYKEALDIAQKWIESARPAELTGEDGLAIRYLGGEAALAYAGTLSGEGPEQVRLRQRCLQAAREAFATVAATAGPYQSKARVRLVDPALGGEPREPAGFADARDRGKAALDRMSAVEAEGRSIPAGDLARRRDCQRRLEQARDEAIKYYSLAAKALSPGTPAAEIDALRYYLAYLHFKAGDFREAVSLGETLARHPEHGDTAREGAMIALAGYDALFRTAATAEQRRQASQGMRDIAQQILRHWSRRAEADEARLVLLQAAAAEGRLDEAGKILQEIPTDSRRRGEAELSLGQALWSTCQRSARQAASQPLPRAELQERSQQAQNLLEEGVARIRASIEAGETAPSLLAAAVLTLAQISLSDGHPAQALRWLEDPKLGAKTLVDARSPAAQSESFAVETYKTDWRACVAAGELQKADQAAQELEDLVQKGDAAEAGRRLTQICIGVGRQLQDEAERLRLQPDVQGLAKLRQAFDRLGGHVVKGQEESSLFGLFWAAEAMLGMGAGLDTGGVKPPADAGKFYRRATDLYQAILHRCETNKKSNAQAEAATAVRLRLARCLRRQGQCREALGLLLAILKEHPTMVDAQLEAAYTYQTWGEEKPECYELAIQGSQVYREVWGWAELSRRVQASPSYQETFHEARYNLALCRFQQAQGKTDPRQQDELLTAAENDILVLAQFCPDMGGKAWHEKYNELLKRIQRFHQRSEPRRSQ